MTPSNPHYPTMFGLHVWDSLYQSSNPKVPENISFDEIDLRMKQRHERGQYIEYLSHKGPSGAFGSICFVDNLPVR